MFNRTLYLLNFQPKREEFFLSLLAIIFFLVYSYLTIVTFEREYPKFNSPDETANFTFTRLYAQEGALILNEPLNLVAENVVHPRSVTVVHGNLVPGSFLGIILIYGTLAKIFGSWIITFLTPLIASLAVLFFYGLIKTIFDRKIAFISSLLFFILPPFWYYANRALMPNVLFVSLLIIGFYFLAAEDKIFPFFFKYILAGFFIGLALMTNLASVSWVILMLLIIFIYYRKNLKWPSVFFLPLALILTSTPIFYYQQILYESPLATGYAEMGGSFPPFSFTDFEVHPLLSFIFSFLIPFGVHPKIILTNFYEYFIELLWYIFIPLVLGFVLIINQLKKVGSQDKFDYKGVKVKLYLGLFAFIGLWLSFYYGSWQIFDEPSTGQVTVGSSFVRYWLPVYVFSLPLVSLTLIKLKFLFKKNFLRTLAVATFTSFLVIFNSYLTFWGTAEGLAQVASRVIEYKERANLIKSLTEDSSVVITEGTDKIVFPERRVINFLEEQEKILSLLPRLVKIVSLYYYTNLDEADIQYLNKTKFNKYNLEAKIVQQISSQEYLYQFYALEKGSSNN